ALRPISDPLRARVRVLEAARQEEKKRQAALWAERRLQEAAVIQTGDDSPADLDARMKEKANKERKDRRRKNLEAKEADGGPDEVESAMVVDSAKVEPGEFCKSEEALDGILLGINAVTGELERMVQSLRNPTVETSAGHDVQAVFVCRGDAPAEHLISHLPVLASLVGPEVRLVGLEKGSEAAITSMLGMSRVLAVAVKVELSEDSRT
ncbi:hypothetical protein HK405_011099, partial [Cladochytrium tenue]